LRPVQRQPAGNSGTGSAWTKTEKRDPERTREAIAAVAATATFPAGVAKANPTPDEIRLDHKLGGDALAQVRPKNIPSDPANHWRWMAFAPSLIEGSEVQAQAIITHELVHIAQFKKVWGAYEKDTSPGRPSWEKYLEPFQKRARVEGPEELEAHVTSLDFLKRLAPDEQGTALRGLFSSYVSTSAYVPPAGETMAITTEEVGPRILDSYKGADPALQERMGRVLWWALLNVGPAKATWVTVLRELKPIAVKGYADPTFRQLYDDALAAEGIKLATRR
jgi:hypothetical protein